MSAPIRSPRRRVATLVGVLLAALAATPAPEPEPPRALPRDHTTVLPEEEFARVLELHPDGIYLSYGEFLDLWERAHTSERELPPPPGAPAARVSTAELSARVEGERLAIHARLALDVRARGYALVPLPLGELPWREATLSGAPAALTRLADGRAAVLVEGPVATTLEGELSAPVRAVGSGGTARLELPALPALGLRLEVPGRAEISAHGEGVLDTELVAEDDGERTRAEIHVATPGAVELAWRPRRASDAADPGTAFRATSNSRLATADGLLTLSSTVDLDVYRGALGELELSLPEPWRPVRLSHPRLAEWRIVAASADAPTGRLMLRFAPPLEGTSRLELEALRVVPAEPWQAELSVPVVLGSRRHTGRLTVLGSGGRRLELLRAQGLEPVPAEDADALATYRLRGADHALALAARPPRELALAESTTRVELAEGRATVHHALGVTLLERRLFELEIEIPESLRVRSVDALGTPLPGAEGRRGMQRPAPVPVDWHVVEDPPRRLVVRLPAGLADRPALSIRVEGEEPVAALDGDAPATLAVPRLVPRGMDEVAGRILFFSDGSLDVEERSREGLEPTGPSGGDDRRFVIGYRYEGAEHSGRLALSRAETRVECAQVARVGVDARTSQLRARLRCEATGGGLRELRLALPHESGEAVRIEASGSEERFLESSDPERGDVWVLRLPGRAPGATVVDVELERPLDVVGEATELALPELVVLGVDRSDGWVVLEASDDMSLALENPRGLAEVDRTDLPPWAPASSGRVLAYQRFFEQPTRLAVAAAPIDERAVLGAIVEQLSVRTQLGATLRSRAEAVVRNRALQVLPLELPEGSELWAVRVDGVGVKPTRRADGGLGIPLDERVDGSAVQVRIDYARPPGFRWLGVTSLAAPRFGDVPVGETHWTVHLPDGRELVGTGGNMRAPELVALPHPLAELPRWLATNPVTLALSPLMGAREKALHFETDGAAMRLPASAPQADASEHLPAAPSATSFAKARAAHGTGLLSMELEAPFEGRALHFARPEGGAELAIRTMETRTARALGGLAAVGTALALVVAVRRRGRSLLFGTGAGLAVTALLPGLLWEGLGVVTAPAACGLIAGAALLTALRFLEGRPRLAVAAALALGVVVPVPMLARADEVAAPTSENGVRVFVPYGEAPTPPTAATRAYLPRGDFEELWARAHAERDRAAPPVDAVLSAARYDGRVDGDALRLRGRLGVDVLAEGWARVPLDFGPLALLSARTEDGILPIERIDGVPTLTLRGPARLVVEVELEAAARRGAGGRGSARLAFPRAGAAHLSLALPAAGLTVEATPAPGGLTVHAGPPSRVELPLTGGAVELGWRREARAESALAAELEGSAESLYLAGANGGELRFTLEATPRGAPVEAVELVAEPGLEPLAAEGPDVAATEVSRLEDGRTRVRVRLARPTSEALSLSLDWLWSYPDATALAALPRVVVEGDRRLRSGVTLAPSPELAVAGESLAAPGWLRRAVPPAIAASLTDGHRAAASFERRAGTTAEPLRPAMRRVTGRASARVESTVRVRDGELVVDARARFEVRDAPRYRLELVVLGEGEIEAVEDGGAGGDASPTTSRPLPHRVVDEGEGRRRVVVDLPRPVLGERVLALAISRPAPSLAAVLEGTVELPVPIVIPRDVERAVLEVAIESVAGFEVEPRPGPGFEPVPSERGRRYRAELDVDDAASPGATLTLALGAAALRVEATALDHLVVEEGRVETRTRIVADVVRGRVDRLHLLAPTSARAELRVEEPEGQRRIRSVTREDDAVDGRDRWTVRLHEAASGPIELLLRRRTRAPAGELVELGDVALQEATTLRRWVLVDNRSTGEVEVERASGLGPARIEELPLEPAQRTPVRPVRVARADAAGWSLALRADRLASGELVRAVVHEARLESSVTRDGLLRTRARYRVQNASQPTLRIALPEGAELWSVKVAGAAAKPARDPADERIVVVPILKNAPGDRAFEVELVTRDDLGPLGLSGWERLRAPRVTNLPVSRTSWTLWVPPEQRYLRFGGNLAEVVSVEVTHQRIRGLVDEAKALEGQIAQLEGASLANARQNLVALQQEADQLYADAVSERPDAYLRQKQVGGRAERRYERMWQASVNEMAGETRAELERATRSAEQQLRSLATPGPEDREAEPKALHERSRVQPARPEPALQQSRVERLRRQAMKEEKLADPEEGAGMAYERAEVLAEERFDHRGAGDDAIEMADPDAFTDQVQVGRLISASSADGDGAFRDAPVTKAGLLSLDVSIPTAGLVRYDFGKVGGEATLSVQHARRGIGAWLGRWLLLIALVAGAWVLSRSDIGPRLLEALLSRPRRTALAGVACVAATPLEPALGWPAIALLVIGLVGERRKRRARATA